MFSAPQRCFSNTLGREPPGPMSMQVTETSCVQGISNQPHCVYLVSEMSARKDYLGENKDSGCYGSYLDVPSLLTGSRGAELLSGLTPSRRWGLVGQVVLGA